MAKRRKTLPAEFSELAERGVQVVPNILTEAECEEAKLGIHSWFEKIGVRRDVPGDWSDDNLPQHNHYIYQYAPVPYIQAVMDVRQHPKVHDVFRRLWETDNLWSSLDAICVRPPYEWLGQAAPVPKTWFHFDQGKKRLGLQCLQGFVTLEHMNEDDATLLVLEKTHQHHADFLKHFDADFGNSDWVKLKPHHETWLRQQVGVQERRVVAPKGSMVLWDSRTVHCSSVPLPARREPHWRYVIYTCQMPAEGATAAQRTKRQKAFLERRTTNHYPIDGTLFPKPSAFPAWRKGRWLLPSLEYPVQLTPLGRKLFVQPTK